MIFVPGRVVKTCERVSRREWLRVGGLGALGLSLPRLLDAHTDAHAAAERPLRPDGFGRARSCIVLFMFGAPAHQDTWDLKPHAPREFRGEFEPIASSVPGITVGEHVPRLARLADRFVQIRSVTHPDNTHTVAMHFMLTGVRHNRPSTNPQNAPDDFPCFGAVANYLARRANASGFAAQTAPDSAAGLPPAVSLNAPANQVSANNHIFPGFFAGFLGHAYDPLFVGQSPTDADFQPLPYVDNPARLLARRDLLATFDRQARLLEQSAQAAGLQANYEEAVRLLTSAVARNAFRVQDEPDSVRARYGATPFGQGCLLARRLVEAGVKLVTVNWERDDAYWDTHSDNFNKHKNVLLPNMDRGFSALLEDLSGRGLLDETLIVWLGEFGRTPKINKNAGRDHWAACNTVLLAGAGLPGGQVYGSSDRNAAFPALNPVSPEDLAATIYHLLGVDPHTILKTPLGRPHPLTRGEPITALI